MPQYKATIMLNSFKQFPNLISEVSEKIDGPMGLSYQVDQDKKIKKRRQGFLKKFNVDIKKLVTANLVHGNNVAIVDINNAGTVIRDTDALITNNKDIFLSVTVADCLPIFYFDPVQKVAALAHAGWKGVVGEIAGKVVHTMEKKFTSNPSNILVGIGPHIYAEHYEVKADVADQFAQYDNDVIIQRNELTFLDLAKALTIQLQVAGVGKYHIEISDDCTYSLDNQYYSYRRDKPKKLETMLVFFGMRDH